MKENRYQANSTPALKKYGRTQPALTQPSTQNSNYRPNEPYSAKKFKAPGLYFDDNNQQEGQVRNAVQKVGFSLTEQTQQLYSPYQYLHYATKVNSSQESYINSLQQLGYENAPHLLNHPYNEIINQTKQLIQKTYSMKYIGIIQGNMGILSRRVKIDQYDPVYIAQMKDVIPMSTLQQNKQAAAPENQLADSDVKAEGGIESTAHQVNNHSMPAIDNQTIKAGDSAASYVVGKYALPRGLKAVRQERDEQYVQEKQKLEIWHASQIKRWNGADFDGLNETPLDTIKKIVNKQPIKRSAPIRKVISNYEEYPEEGVCCAMIEQVDQPILSYSRLVNGLSQGQTVPTSRKYRNSQSQNGHEDMVWNPQENLLDRYSKIKLSAIKNQEQDMYQTLDNNDK